MSSDTDTGNNVNTDKPHIVRTIKHADWLAEELSCSSSAALVELIKRCNREGRKLFAGHELPLPENSPRIDYFLTLDGSQSVIEHSLADQVISIECGISIADLQRMLKQNNQWFPVCLYDETISLMEYINLGSSGPLEHGFGEARDLVLGMQVVLGSGELIKCGGKVVKNVTGYDLPKLFTGSHATLCVPFSAHLRLFALPETSGTILCAFADSKSAFQVARKLCLSGLPISCMEMTDGKIIWQTCDLLGYENLKIDSSNNQTWLCVQVHGSPSVVAELEKEITEIAAQSDTNIKLLEQYEKQFWKLIAKPQQLSDSRWLELCAPIATLEDLILELSKDQQVSWTARPGRNKTTLIFSSKLQTNLDYLLTRISEILRSKQASVTAAFQDDQYLWNVRKLPNEDLVLNELKHRLKREYDPHGVLNPLAEM